VRAEQAGLGAVAVLDAGGAHGDGEQQAEGVGDDEPFPPVDLLARVVAAHVAANGVGPLHALGVDDPRRRLPAPPVDVADLLG
jgi:hypothetical protein